MKILFRALTLSGLLATTSMAAELSVSVFDQNGKAVSNAVVYVSQIDGQVPQTSPMLVEVDQIDETFVPHVRAATVGSTVSFPNSDHVRHHVYSFSEAKTFELPLYSGIDANPIVFEKAGVVTLGCNIHDHMLGYILLVPSPFFIEITDGAGQLGAIPEGTLQVEIWHPLLADDNTLVHQVTVTAEGSHHVEFNLTLKPEPMLRRAPRRKSSRY